MSIGKIASTVLTIILISGCAITDIRMTDSYKPRSTKSLTAPKEIFLEIDDRQSDIIGVKKNGYGHETANVYLNQAQSAWLKKALTAEFEAYGFTVSNTPKNDIIQVKGLINQLFVEPDVGFWQAKLYGISDLNVYAKIPGKGEYKRNFVEIEYSPEMVWTDGDFIERFHDVTSKSLADIAHRINELSKN